MQWEFSAFGEIGPEMLLNTFHHEHILLKLKLKKLLRKIRSKNLQLELNK